MAIICKYGIYEWEFLEGKERESTWTSTFTTCTLSHHIHHDLMNHNFSNRRGEGKNSERERTSTKE